MSISEHLDGYYLDFESIWDRKGRLVLPVSDSYVFSLLVSLLLLVIPRHPMRPSIAGLFLACCEQQWFIGLGDQLSSVATIRR